MSAGREVTRSEAVLRRVRCFAGDVDSAADALIERALGGAGGYACLANVHVVVTASRDPALLSALESAWAVYPDGSPIAWLVRKLGSQDARRVAGPDLMPATLDRGQDAAVRHFLFGTSEDGLVDLSAHIRGRFPGVEIVGTCAPPFGEVDGSYVAAIAASEPHIVWCALGAPKQELWMARYARELAPAVVVGVGAAFDFLAGSKKRAPRWAQDLGLEWLHRLWSEPARLGPRYLATNTRFLLDVGHGLLGAGRR